MFLTSNTLQLSDYSKATKSRKALVEFDLKLADFGSNFDNIICGSFMNVIVQFIMTESDERLNGFYIHFNYFF